MQSLHAVLYYVFSFLPLWKGKKALVPGIVFHSLFTVIAIVNTIFEIYDMESRREYQGKVSLDILDAYVLHAKRRFASITYGITDAPEIKTSGGASVNISTLESAMIESTLHWSILLVIIFIAVGLVVIILVLILKYIWLTFIPISIKKLSSKSPDSLETSSIGEMDLVSNCNSPKGLKSDTDLDKRLISNSSTGKIDTRTNDENASIVNSVILSDRYDEVDRPDVANNAETEYQQLNGESKDTLVTAIKKCTRKSYKKCPESAILKRAKDTSLKGLSIAYWTYPFNIVLLCFALVGLISMPICFTTPESNPFVLTMPSAYLLVQDLFVKYNNISQEEFKDVSNDMRIQLQPYLDMENRYFLDTRDVPNFPLMHGDLEDFCRLNPSDEKCSNRGIQGTKKMRYLPNSARSKNVNHQTTIINGEEESSNKDPSLVNGEDTEFDIVLLIIESFSPSSAYIDNKMEKIFTDNPDKLVYKFEDVNNPNKDGPTGYYDEAIMPNLHELTGSGSFVVFPGISSQSLPTINGWFSLVTQTGSWGSQGMIDGRYLHTGDIFTIATEMGFGTFYLSPSPLDFDGKDGVMYKLPAEEEAIAQELVKIKKSRKKYEALINNNWKFTDEQREDADKIYEEIKNDPLYNNSRTIDTAIYSLPYPEMMEDMEAYLAERYPLEDADFHIPKRNNRWICDRVTSLEFLYYFQHFEDGDLRCEVDRVLMAKNGETEKPRDYPIFAGYANVGTHMPFLGFDDDTEKEGYSERTPTDDRYPRALRLMDKYQVGRTIDFLKTRERDSVVVIVGDHGARVTDLDANTNEYCRPFDLGGEQFYTTSATIGYIKGTREGERRNMFLDKYGDLLGTVYNGPADHADLTATLLAIASMDVDKDGSRLYVPPNPSTGRNLFEVIRDYESGENKNRSDFFTHSMVSLQKEIRLEREGKRYLLRGHANSHKDYILLSSEDGANGTLIYPSCRDEGGELSEEMKEVAAEMQETFERRRDFLHYIIGHDKIYHPGFVKGDELPDAFPPAGQTPVGGYLVGLVMLCWFCVVVLAYSIAGCVLAGKFHLCRGCKKSNQAQPSVE